MPNIIHLNPFICTICSDVSWTVRGEDNALDGMAWNGGVELILYIVVKNRGEVSHNIETSLIVGINAHLPRMSIPLDGPLVRNRYLGALY